MTRDSESNNKERFIVLVVISVNATVSVLLIAGMVYSFTLITQQQEEITNLHRLLHKSMPAKQQSKKQSTADEHEEVISIETRLKVQKESKGKNEGVGDNANGNPLILREEIPICCGVKGKRGKHGPKGNTGEKGDRGEAGRDGMTGRDGIPGRDGTPAPKGRRGEKGADGVPGMKGSKGNEGRNVLMYASAHIVGSGAEDEMYLSGPANDRWKLKHYSGSMTYKDGKITVGVDGYYFIYSQMYYCGGDSDMVAHKMYIDDQEVLKVGYSVVNNITGKYATKYTGGIFKISKGQTISVSTSFTGIYFYFGESESFFGAFLLHP